MATDNEQNLQRRLEDKHPDAKIDWTKPEAPAVPLSSTAGAARQGGITSDETSPAAAVEKPTGDLTDEQIVALWREVTGTDVDTRTGPFARAIARAAIAAHLAKEPKAEQRSNELHNAIMNLPCKRDDASFLKEASRLLYKEGHRDARHAAAELALGAPVAPAVAQEMRIEQLEACCKALQAERDAALAHCDVLRERAKAVAQEAQHKAVPEGWISVEDDLPTKECLAIYVTEAGKQRMIRAKYARKFQIEAEGDDCETEYNDDDDTFYIKAGWLECIDNWGEYSSCYVTEGTVTHWMPLPALPGEVAQEAAKEAEQGSVQAMVEAGALRQYRHNDGSEGFVFAYDKAITDRVLASTSTATASDSAQNEEILALHRQLSAEKLRADQGWSRAEAKSKECIELRERQASAQASQAAASEAWREGVLMAASTLVSVHDMPTMAASILVELGLRDADCSSLDEFDKANLLKIQESGRNMSLRGLRTNPATPASKPNDQE